MKPSAVHRLTVTVQLWSLWRADQHQNHVDTLVPQSSTWVNVFAFYQLVCVFPMIIAMCYYTYYTVVLFHYWTSDWALRIYWSEFNMIIKLLRLYVCNELLSNEVRDDYDSVRKETRDECRLSAGFMRVEVEEKVERRRDTKRLERQKRHEEITTQRCGGWRRRWSYGKSSRVVAFSRPGFRLQAIRLSSASSPLDEETLTGFISDPKSLQVNTWDLLLHLQTIRTGSGPADNHSVRLLTYTLTPLCAPAQVPRRPRLWSVWAWAVAPRWLSPSRSRSVSTPPWWPNTEVLIHTSTQVTHTEPWTEHTHQILGFTPAGRDHHAITSEFLIQITWVLNCILFWRGEG